CRKARILAQSSRAEAKILRERFEEGDAASFAAFFFGAFAAPKFDTSAAKCFGARQAVPDQFVGVGIHVEAELGVHVAFETGAAEGVGEPEAKSRPEPHMFSGAAPRIPAMTSDMRLHFCVSTCRRRLPAVVRR